LAASGLCDPKTVAQELLEGGFGQVVQFTTELSSYDDSNSVAAGTYRPVVQMHGMGDYANNPMGMIPLRNLIAKQLNTYVVNAALADTDSGDQMGEFFQTLDKEVESFAAFIKNDSKLAKGFNAIGYSQGNLIIRGYIEKYNSPPVFNWISVHGPLVGVAGFPRCQYSSSICQLFDKFLGDLAYNALAQGILAQSNYLRDPNRIPEYLSGCQFLPFVNNEKNVDATYKKNFLSLEKLVAVKALKDTMIFPNDSEWWGFYADGSNTQILAMNETKWYQEDLFGLQTFVKAGKHDFLTTPGDHLQFSDKFISNVVKKYLTN